MYAWELDDKKLYIELKSPFNLIYDLNKTQEWGRLYDVIMNLDSKQVILIDKVVSIFNLGFNIV